MSRWNIFWRLLAIIRSMWGVMIFSIIMRTLNQCSGIAILTLGTWGISQAIAQPASDLCPIFTALIVIGLFKGILRYLEQFSGHYVAFRLLATIRDRFYRGIEPLAPAIMMNNRSGDMVSRAIADVERIEVFYAHTIAPAITAFFMSAITLITLSYFDGLLALTLLPFLIGVGLLAPWISDLLGKNLGIKLRRAVAEVNAHLIDSIQGLREIVAFGHGTARLREIRERGNILVNIQARSAHIAGLQNGFTDGLVAAGTLSVLGMGLLLVEQGRLNPLYLPPIVALTTTSFGPILSAASVIQSLNQALASAGRLFAVMDQKPTIQDGDTMPQEPIEPSIHFHDVFFRYKDNNSWLLRGLEFNVPAGSTIALVGSSGMGKTTVVNLLLRFWDVNKGRIDIGRYDIRNLPQEYLRQHIAVVSQYTHLFNTTIRENLRLSNPHVCDAEIEQAARLANIHNFIVSLPQGYDMQVGEMGIKLSGGQRQRLAIARALLKDSPILVLDEATSSLEAETESKIQTSIRQLMKGRTTLVIAHRLSTVVNADEILVIDAGHIVERGQHAKLLIQGGIYTRIFARQQDELINH